LPIQTGCGNSRSASYLRGMNGIEKRVRNAINPYSTAFSRWWCQSGRYLLPGRLSRRPAGRPDGAARAAHRRVSSASMAARRAAIDDLLASPPQKRREDP